MPITYWSLIQLNRIGRCVNSICVHHYVAAYFNCPPDMQYRLFNVDIHKELDVYCNASKNSNCEVTVLAGASFLTSFVSMCEADVLITSTSGNWIQYQNPQQRSL